MTDVFAVGERVGWTTLRRVGRAFDMRAHKGIILSIDELNGTADVRPQGGKRKKTLPLKSLRKAEQKTQLTEFVELMRITVKQ